MMNKVTHPNLEAVMGTHYITDECIACGTCEPVCPVTAIKWEQTAG